ncbi:MAG: DUF447 family protein [Candidatus Bathyarchaeota archaeon]|nr:MAG: DUF447 family protein [Candidatus Bathyarchaeota archaeon]
MSGIEWQLDELGFVTGSVHEAIVTTMSSDGSLNAAPMGVTRTGPETLELKLFTTSTTCANLLSNPSACVNVTEDPALYLVTAFKEADFPGFPVPSIDRDLRLGSSDAHVLIAVEKSLEESKLREVFNGEVSSVEVTRSLPRVFSRGRAEAIEAIIHATRIEVFSKQGDKERVERLIKRFRECKDVVNRTSVTDSNEARVIRELEKMIEGWRDRASG